MKGLGQDTASGSDSYFLPTSLTPKVCFLSLSSVYVSLCPTLSFSALASWFQKSPSPRGAQGVWPGSWGAPWPWSSSLVWLLPSSFCITGSRRAGWRSTGAGECEPAHPLSPPNLPHHPHCPPPWAPAEAPGLVRGSGLPCPPRPRLLLLPPARREGDPTPPAVELKPSESSLCAGTSQRLRWLTKMHSILSATLRSTCVIIIHGLW